MFLKTNQLMTAMENNGTVVVRGLKDVVATETRISFVDPNGYLYYAGYNIDDLAGSDVSFEEVVHLLWYNRLPNKTELAQLRASLISEMELPDQVIDRFEEQLTEEPPHGDPSHRDLLTGRVRSRPPQQLSGSSLIKALKLVAKVPTIIAYLHLIREGLPLIAPDKKLDFSTNFLYMFRGVLPNQTERKTINRYMVLHANHGTQRVHLRSQGHG